MNRGVDEPGARGGQVEPARVVRAACSGSCRRCWERSGRGLCAVMRGRGHPASARRCSARRPASAPRSLVHCPRRRRALAVPVRVNIIRRGSHQLFQSWLVRRFRQHEPCRRSPPCLSAVHHFSGVTGLGISLNAVTMEPPTSWLMRSMVTCKAVWMGGRSRPVTDHHAAVHSISNPPPYRRNRWSAPVPS